MLQISLITLLALLSTPSGSAPDLPDGLRVTAQNRRQLYCDDDLQGSLELDVRVALFNGGTRNLIVPRQTGGASIERAAAARGDPAAPAWTHVGWECGLIVDTEETMRLVPRPIDGPVPDPGQFVVLRPGETHEVDVTTSLFMGPSPGYAQYVPPEGEDFFVDVVVLLWPFRLDDEERVRALRERWNATGQLLDGPISTGPIRVVASAGPRPKCSSAAGDKAAVTTR